MVSKRAASTASPDFLEVGDTNAYLRWRNGESHFWVSDSAYWLVELSDADLTTYLTKRADQGFNVIHFSVLPRAGNRNADNIDPFEQGSNAVNPAYFARVDHVVSEIRRFGMQPMISTYLGGGYRISPRSLSISEVGDLCEFVGNRYPDAILGVGNTTDGSSSGRAAYWKECGDRMRAAAPDTMVTALAYWDEVGREEFPNASDWPQLNMVGTPYRVNAPVHIEQAAAAAAADLPVMNDLSVFEEVFPYPGGNTPANPPRMTTHEIRTNGYRSVFGDGVGLYYLSIEVFQLWETTDDPLFGARLEWRLALEHAFARQVQYLRNLMESRPYEERSRNDAVVATSLNEDDPGFPLAIHAPGKFAMVYVPDGAETKVDFGVLNFAGAQAQLTWYSPRSGSVIDRGTRSSVGQVPLSPPTMGEDWVLVIDNASLGYPPPGTGLPN